MEGERADLKKFLGSNYLVNFSENVDTLVRAYSQYSTVEVAVVKGTGEIDLDTVRNYSQTMRTYVLRCWISFLTLHNQIIKGNVGSKPTEEETKRMDAIKAIVDSCKEHEVINGAEIELFLVEINAFLYSEPIKKLMETATDVLNDLFKGSQDGSGK